MQRAVYITVAVLLPLLPAHAGRADDRALGRRFIDRAVQLSGEGSAYIHEVPAGPRRDYRGLARSLKQALLDFSAAEKYRQKDDPFIIYSTDPPTAVAVARIALSDCPRRSLRDMRVICIVGTQYAASLQAAAAEAGARLEAAPVPRKA